MKTFFISLLGTLVGLILFAAGIIVVVLAFVGLAVSSSQGEQTVTVEPGSYLVFDLNANITDAPPASALAGLIGGDTGGPATLQLRTVTRALRAAAKDGRIAGVFLTGSLAPDGLGTGFAALKEVRAALQEFKAAKKPVLAYLETADTRDYYLAAGADDIALDPYGAIFLSGLASEPLFFAGALEKFGVGVQVTKVGAYKSATETFTRKDMSPENRAQTQKLLDDLWAGLRSDMAADRGLTPTDLQTIADKQGLLRAEAAKTAKLVTRVAYRDEVLADLKKRTGVEASDEPFKQVTLSDYADEMDQGSTAPKLSDQQRLAFALDGKHAAALKSPGPRLALVYAEGSIVEGEGMIGEVGGARFARELRALREDADVKAIVLRVNSPGGSVTASEQIRRELKLTREKKPVIVSMGSYAASGGYWISADATRIFAEPETITGSIGVFGLHLNLQKLANDYGFTFDGVKTGKFADALTISRPKTDAELALFQEVVDWIYGEFITKVAEGRKLDPAKVREIAEGRVWSGAAALPLGLIDEIGGLDAALTHAADQAGLGATYTVDEFPRPKDWIETVTDLLEHRVAPEAHANSGGMVTQIVTKLQAQARALEQFNDPRGLYARLPFELLAH
jgi:protease-4